MTVAELPAKRVRLQFPRTFQKVLTSKCRYIIPIGGRGSAKSQSASQWLLDRVDLEACDLLCVRELQNSLDDSVHKLNLSMLERAGIEDVVDTDKKIDFGSGGKVRYKGFGKNSSAARSAEGYKLLWIEEGQELSKESMTDLFPTIREDDSQIIITGNPMASTDPFSQRFIVPYLDALTRDGYYQDDMHLIFMMNWRDNPWWNDVLEKERVWDLNNLPRAEYDHKWEGAFNDSVDGSIIKAEWFDAAIDAHIKLGFKPKGFKIVSHDPADTGDAKALVLRHGSVILDAQEKTDGDVNDGCDWATGYAIQNNVDMFSWDCDGLGISLKRQVTDALEGKKIDVELYKGSEKPVDPLAIYDHDERLEPSKSKTNEETFRNKRAQYYWWLRDRFFNTYRAVKKGEYVDPDKLISISSKIECLSQFRSEVCRIPKKHNPNGMIQIMSKDEMKRIHKIESPNLADSAMMSLQMPHRVKRTFDKDLNIPSRSYPGQRR